MHSRRRQCHDASAHENRGPSRSDRPDCRSRRCSRLHSRLANRSPMPFYKHTNVKPPTNNNPLLRTDLREQRALRRGCCQRRTSCPADTPMHPRQSEYICLSKSRDEITTFVIIIVVAYGASVAHARTWIIATVWRRHQCTTTFQKRKHCCFLTFILKIYHTSRLVDRRLDCMLTKN